MVNGKELQIKLFRTFNLKPPSFILFITQCNSSYPKCQHWSYIKTPHHILLAKEHSKDIKTFYSFYYILYKQPTYKNMLRIWLVYQNQPPPATRLVVLLTNTCKLSMIGIMGFKDIKNQNIWKNAMLQTANLEEYKLSSFESMDPML